MWLFISVVWVLGWAWAASNFDQGWMMLVGFVPIGIAAILSKTLWIWPDSKDGDDKKSQG